MVLEKSECIVWPSHAVVMKTGAARKFSSKVHSFHVPLMKAAKLALLAQKRAKAPET